MPVKNGEAFVGDAIESTLRIMGPADRLYIIDDGSTDTTSDQIRHRTRKDVKVTHLTNPHSLGVAASLNKGLEQVRTEFVARIDADDICLPWRLRLSMANIMRLRVDFLFTNAILFGTGIRMPVPSPGLGIAAEAMGRRLAESNPLIHSTLLARTSAMRSLGGYKTDTQAEDYDLWIRAQLAGYRIAKVAVPTIKHRIHSAQTTRTEKWVKGYSAPNTRQQLRKSLGLEVEPIPSKGSAVREMLTNWLFRM